MFHHIALRRAVAAGALALGLRPAATAAQTLDDADFMKARVACLTVVVMTDAWSEYWEGALKRTNGNIGTLTMQEVSTMAAYGVTDNLTLLATLPYVRTEASQGVLQGQRGLQDLTVGAKLRLLATPFTDVGTMHVIAVAAASTPVGDYTPDFLPMSIGLGARQLMARGTLSFQAKRGWFANGSVGYAWRDNVTLARSAYYTDGRLVNSNQVAMPDVVDYVFALGWQGTGWDVVAPLTTRRTLGGSDIRRQDMPFVSNRMDVQRLDARLRWTLPRLPAAMLQVGGGTVLDGRNVGQSTTFSAGVVLIGRVF